MKIGFFFNRTFIYKNSHSYTDRFYMNTVIKQTIKIFTDRMIVWVALKYTVNYYRVFRSSAYVLATIWVLISSTIDLYFDSTLWLVTAGLVLILAVAFNFIQKRSHRKGIDQSPIILDNQIKIKVLNLKVVLI